MFDSRIRKFCPSKNKCLVGIGFPILILLCICTFSVIVLLVGYGTVYLWNYVRPSDYPSDISCLTEIWYWDCIGYFWIAGIDTVAIIGVVVAIFFGVTRLIYICTLCCDSRNSYESLIPTDSLIDTSFREDILTEPILTEPTLTEPTLTCEQQLFEKV
jgi:hypothetical protein